MPYETESFSLYLSHARTAPFLLFKMSQTATQSTQSQIGATGVPQTTLTDTVGLPPGAESLPQKLGERFKSLPKLSREQCGHIRHFHNLASTLGGEWGLMGSQELGQEWDTAYRYQLATMTYAAGGAHYHRLPAMRSMFKSLFEKLNAKMLRREFWGYWYLTSQSGINSDPDLK
jgi:hypothetical protein